MKDLEIAKESLAGHTICLCRGAEKIYSEERGIKPLMCFIGRGLDLTGYSAADVVVGKAAALLFAKCKVKAVYAKVLSLSGKDVFEKFGIEYSYGELVEKIINRAGDDICPMEKAVLFTDDPDKAYEILKNKITPRGN